MDKISDPNGTEANYIFLKYENLLVIFNGSDFKDKLTGEERYISYQACFPLKALSWVVKMFEYFFTPPRDGGLPAGRIATTDIVDGEKLQFNRGMYVGGPEHGGYTLTNLSRVNYGRKPDSKRFQEFDFPDPWLFDGGLLEFWKDLATRYERGEFPEQN